MRKLIVIIFVTMVMYNLLSLSPETESEMIVMPTDSKAFIATEWTAEKTSEYLHNLGFTAINTVPSKPNDNNYRGIINQIVIESGKFSEDAWGQGEEFPANSEITIYYNELPLLTIDNSPDLEKILTGTNLDYMTFANRYDGRYIEFDAYVSEHLISFGGTQHIINVQGGSPNDGDSSLDIRIGDRTFKKNIDMSVEEEDFVTVTGKVDADWSRYFRKLYIETMNMEKQ